MSDKQTSRPFPYTNEDHPTSLDKIPESAYKALVDVGTLIPFPVISSCLFAGVAQAIDKQMKDDGDIVETTDFVFVVLAEFLNALAKVMSLGFGYPASAFAKCIQSVATSFKGRVLTVDNRADALQEALEGDNTGPLFYLAVDEGRVEVIPPYYHRRQEDAVAAQIKDDKDHANLGDVLRRMAGGIKGANTQQ